MAEARVKFRQLPPEDVPAFEWLLTLEEPMFIQFCEAINKAPKNMRASTVVANVSKKAQLIPAAKIKAIIFSLKSLLTGMDTYHVSAVQASKDIAQAAIRQSTNNTLKQADKKLYEKRLLLLLSNPNLVLPSKALSLLTDHARTFGSVRIISDIRPVFGENASELPHAWMLYHTLHIKCNIGKDPEDDVYIALDTTDLRIMEDAVKRAANKQKVLITQFKQLKLDYVTPDEVEE